MKNILTAILFSIALFVNAQTDKVTDAETALTNNDFATAYNLADEILSAPSNADRKSQARVSYIRGKAGVRVAYDALLDGGEAEEKKYLTVPMQSYNDFKNAISGGDSTIKQKVQSEYTRLGNALLVAGTKYDTKFKENTEHPDSTMLDKSIENFTAAIEVYALGKNEKFKPYLFRGDAYFTKKKFTLAQEDYLKAMTLFENSPRDNPDFNIGDLGYRLAYMQAAIFNKRDVALQTLAKARKLLDGEMQLANSKKEKLGERYEEYKTEYEYFLGELAELDGKLKQ